MSRGRRRAWFAYGYDEGPGLACREVRDDGVIRDGAEGLTARRLPVPTDLVPEPVEPENPASPQAAPAR